MTTITWLHLTDLHWGMEGQEYRWPNIRESLKRDMRKLRDKHGPWDLVFFTGDMAFKGRFDQFEKAQRLLQNLWQEVGVDNPRQLIVAVPGNHDLIQPDPSEAPVVALEEWHKKSEVVKTFWDNPNSDYRRVVQEAFTDYESWWHDQHAAKFLPFLPGILPGDFSLTIEKDGVRLGVIGLNTAFLQLTDNDYKGKLTLDAKQLHKVCNGDPPKWAQSHHACILLTHHPPEWLSSEGQGELDREILPSGQFAVHLFGHMHKPMQREITVGGGPLRRQWQGPSFFGIEHYQEEGKDFERIHGYTFGKMWFQAHRGCLRFWPRKAICSEGVGWRIIPDHEKITLDEDEGTSVRGFQLNRPHEEPAGSPPPAVLSHEPTSAASRTSGVNAMQWTGSKVPSDYQARNEIEDEVKSWRSSAQPATCVFLSGASGAGKTTTLAKLFEETMALPERSEWPSVWIQLSEERSSIHVARAIVEQLAAYFPEDAYVKHARLLVDRAEANLSRAAPELLLAARSVSLRAELPLTPSHREEPGQVHGSSETTRPSTAAYWPVEAAKTEPALPKSVSFPFGELSFPPRETYGIPPVACRVGGTRSQEAVYGLAGVLETDIYAVLPPSEILRQLADDLAVVWGHMSVEGWVFFIDTFDWLQAGGASAAAPEAQLPSSWLIDYLLPALRTRSRRILVVLAGQMPQEEVTSRFSECGFVCVPMVMDAFTDEEFRAFVKTKGIQDDSHIEMLAEITNRIPHVTRVWFEIMGEGEEAIPKETVPAGQIPQIRTWLWQRMRQRLPGLLPDLFRASAALPAFDRDLLAEVTGVHLSIGLWDRFRAYSLVEASSLAEAEMSFRIKSIWAEALRSDLSEKERQDICQRALDDLRRRTRCLISNLDVKARDTQKKLSLWMLQTAMTFGPDAPEFWQSFLRETARWMLVTNTSVGKELCEIAEDNHLSAPQKRDLSLIRASWYEVGREKIIDRQTILDTLGVLLETDYDIPELAPAVMRPALVLALRRYDKDTVDHLLGLAKRKVILDHEKLLLFRCLAHLRWGNREGALALVDQVPSGTESAECLEELADFCSEKLHDNDRAIRLYAASHEIDPTRANSLYQLMKLLWLRRREREAASTALKTAAKVPDNAWILWCVGAAFWKQKPPDVVATALWCEKAIRLNPNEEEFVLTLLAALHESAGVEDTRRRLEELSGEFPDSAWLAEAMARSYGGYDPKDFGTAAKWHEKAVRLDPNEKQFVENLSVALRKSAGVEDARRRLTDLWKQHSSSITIPCEIAHSLMLDDPAAALEVLASIPRTQWPMNGIIIAGWAHVFLGDYNEARILAEDARRAVSKKSRPGDVRGVIELAIGAGQLGAAKELLQEQSHEEVEPPWQVIDELLWATVRALEAQSALVRKHIDTLIAICIDFPEVRSGWSFQELRTVISRLGDEKYKQTLIAAVDFYDGSIPEEQLRTAADKLPSD